MSLGQFRDSPQVVTDVAKVSNLLQLDRFEEDLNISRVRLVPEPPRPKTPADLAPACSAAEQERGRQFALEQLRQLKAKLRQEPL